MNFKIKKDYIIPAIYLVLFIFYPYYANDFYKYINIIIALILFIYVSTKRNLFTLLKIGYVKWMTILLLLIYLSLLWSENISKAIGGANIFLLTYVGQIGLVWWAYDSSDKLDFILNISLWICVLLLIKTILVTPFSAYGDQVSFALYTGYDKNMYSILASAMTWITTYLYYKYRKRKYIFLWVVMFFMASINGSRKGVLMAILGTPLIISLVSNSRKRIIYLCGYSILAIMAIVAFMNINFLYEAIGQRLENLFLSIFVRNDNNDGSIRERFQLIELALEMFKEKIILGWGANGFAIHREGLLKKFIYSHCNYTELLCNFGITGFLIYYCYSVKLIVNGFKGIKKKNLNAIVSFSIVAIIMVFEYGFVSYYDLSFCFLKSIAVLLLYTSIKDVSIHLE